MSEPINNFLSHHNDANSVDIENECYSLLCECIADEDRVKKVKELDIEFEKLHDLLKRLSGF